MKIPFVGPDVEQAVTYTVQLTFSHNAIPIALVAISVAVLLWALHSPSRGKLLLFIGFMALFLDFEYSKHIMQPLIEQTQVSLQTDMPNYRFIWITNKILTRGIPFLLTLTGTIASALGAYLIIKKEKLAS